MCWKLCFPWPGRGARGSFCTRMRSRASRRCVPKRSLGTRVGQLGGQQMAESIGPQKKRRWLWGAAMAGALLAAASVFLLDWGPAQQPTGAPLEGELIVTVIKKGGEGKQSARID